MPFRQGKEGRPTVSYKGGPVGLVKVIDDQTLAFPGFDGNGMFYSMGNIVGQSHVGLLFIARKPRAQHR